MNRHAARLARELRRHELAANVVIELADEAFRLKKSFEAATRWGRGTFLLSARMKWRRMRLRSSMLASGEQVTVPRGELAAADFADLESLNHGVHGGSRSSPFLEAIMRGILLMVARCWLVFP